MIAWTITELKVSQNPEPNTVTEISYKATHSSGPIRSGTVPVHPLGAHFIAFTDLTEETVLQWLWEVVNRDTTEAILNAQAAQVKPEILPWGNA